MKRVKIITTLIALSTFLSVNAQLSQVSKIKSEKVGAIKVMGQESMTCTRIDNLISITYRDLQYTHIVEYKSFKFEDVDGALDNFTKIVLDGFSNPPKEPISLMLGDSYISLVYQKGMGRVVMKILVQGIVEKGNVTPDGMTGSYTEKQYRKLFDK